MQIIWHGTAAIEIVNTEGQIVFDPFVPLAHSPVPVRIGDFDGMTDIFVTHGHLDHITSIPEIVKRNPRVWVYCTAAPFDTLLKKGVPEKNLYLIQYDDELYVNGFEIHVFHGKHAILPKVGFERLSCALSSPARGNIPFIYRENKVCHENDETVFYQIQAEHRTVFLLGSLNLRDDVEYPTGADVLILPYNGWEDNYLPALRVIARLKPKRVLLDHYDDTFPPVSRPVNLDPILKQENVSAMVLGQVYEV